jgi:hypothetical protein
MTSDDALRGRRPPTAAATAVPRGHRPFRLNLELPMNP